MLLRRSDVPPGRPTLAYDDRGLGETLVLLHAFALDRRMWAAQVTHLVRSLRVVTLDFRGLGESSGSGSIEDAADDVAALLEHLGVERAIIGGISMGGYVALAFVRRHAAMLAGLLLADTRASADDEAGRAARDQAITQIARGETDSYLDALLPKLLASRDRSVIELVRGLGHAQTATGMAGALAAMRDRPDATSVLQDIHVPTTVLVGSEDVLTPPAMAKLLADGIAGAELVVIPGAGHLSNLEAPERFTRAVEALAVRVEQAQRERRDRG